MITSIEEKKKNRKQKQNARNQPGEWDVKSGAIQVTLLPARFTFRDKSPWGQTEEERHANFLQEMLVFNQSILYNIALTQKKSVYKYNTIFILRTSLVISDITRWYIE